MGLQPDCVTQDDMNILIRGGGDIASGVALRAYRAGFNVLITELPQPLAVRRTVSFSEAIYEGTWTVEGATARRAESAEQAVDILNDGDLPVMISPDLESLPLDYQVLIDARLIKSNADYALSSQPMIIGLGPGFFAGRNCHAVVETNRGHMLGRVYWKGSAQPDTGAPEGDARRVLRAPCDGIITSPVKIGQYVEPGQVVAQVDGEPVISPLGGVIRGLIRPGLMINKGLKIGDVDPRNNPSYCNFVSDKALAVGGGVLEAILHYFPK
jgi:xanthine dehydrogenase accessory factor